MKQPPHWTPAEDALALSMYRDGKSRQEISRAVRRTVFAVKNRLAVLQGRKTPKTEAATVPEPVRVDDGQYVALCRAQGGFRVLNINYPRKAA